jgi:hypothetical protein
MASCSTRSIRIGTGILVVLALGVGAATGSAGTADQSAWQKALHIRSEGLNAAYGLGDHPLGKLSAPEPAWQRALTIRSEGLNLRYGVGAGTLGTASTLRRHDALGALGASDRQQALELVGLKIDRGQRLSSTQ